MRLGGTAARPQIRGLPELPFGRPKIAVRSRAAQIHFFCARDCGFSYIYKCGIIAFADVSRGGGGTLSFKTIIVLVGVVLAGVFVYDAIETRRAEEARRLEQARQAEIVRCKRKANNLRAALGQSSEMESRFSDSMEGLSQLGAMFLGMYSGMPTDNPRLSRALQQKAREIAQEQVERSKLKAELEGVTAYLSQLNNGFKPRSGIC